MGTGFISGKEPLVCMPRSLVEIKKHTKMNDFEEIDHEVLDRQVLREMDRLTSGSASHHRAMQPDEFAMLNEEPAEIGTDELREEIFSGVCSYTLASGFHPGKVRERMEVMMRRFAPELLSQMSPWAVWWNETEVNKIIIRLADKVEPPCFQTLFELSGKIREELDESFVYSSFNQLCRFWVEDGYDWKRALSSHFVIIKSLRPELIGQMSLEDLAVLCGDKGKATVSARAKRIFSRRLESVGMHGTHAHFQKSPEAVEKYRAAQLGNQNRKKK